MLHAPAFLKLRTRKRTLLETAHAKENPSEQGETHTHTRSRAAALPGRAGLPHEQQITGRNLNRNVKSLINERKKHIKSKAKRQERKIGVVKKEYLALDWGRETSVKNHL